MTNGVAPAAGPERQVTTKATRLSGRTDTANAWRFVESHRGSVCFVLEWNSWLVWNGGWWDRDPKGVLVTALAKESARTFLSECVESDRSEADLKWAVQSLNRSRIESAINLARDHVAIRADQLDANPWILPLENGAVDLRTGVFMEPDPTLLVTKVAPIRWSEDPSDFRAPRWQQALEEWFPDVETRAYVQRLAGQALFGLQREHVFVIHFGDGGNGKGTFIRAIEAALGQLAVTMDDGLIVQKRWGVHDTATANLQGARLAVASETDRKVKLSEASIKNLTGGDRIRARHLYGHPFAFEPTHTVWLVTNYLPEISGRDKGIWRRVRVVPWTVTFDSTPELDLDEKLKGEQLGILRWAVEGAKRWLEDGLEEPRPVSDATLRYQESEDLLERFANDVGLVFGEGNEIKATTLIEMVDEWARGEGVDSPKRDLNAWLINEKECVQVRRNVAFSDRSRKLRFWLGVGSDTDWT